MLLLLSSGYGIGGVLVVILVILLILALVGAI